MSKIYVASSWRNDYQQSVVEALRNDGHSVYDFKNPQPGSNGFAWSEVDKNWLGWTPETFREHLKSPIAQAGFRLDKSALDWCTVCVLVLPCGRSAHLEAGYAAGAGKKVIFFLRPEKFEPELMYLLGQKMVCDMAELLLAV